MYSRGTLAGVSRLQGARDRGVWFYTTAIENGSCQIERRHAGGTGRHSNGTTKYSCERERFRDAFAVAARTPEMCMSRMPSFVIIGAMKCATSTLHDQLERQPGVFMSDPKEPCYFSDDEVYAKGESWYLALFEDAPPGALCGESSTHYTKLPTYPRTVERMKALLPDLKLIYVMRHPIDRLVSQYIHEWSERTISGPLEVAVRQCPRLIDYSRYALQLRPYLDAYGHMNVLPVFLERIADQSQSELERVCRFIGYESKPSWHIDLSQRNVSDQRLRSSAARDAIVRNPGVMWFRRRFIPQTWRDAVKGFWQMKDRPKLSEQLENHLRTVFDKDLSVVGAWLGAELTCANFKEAVSAGSLEFSNCVDGSAV